MLATLPFTLNFVHPLSEWGLLAMGGWALYLGIKAKKTRTGTPEQRKELVKGKFAQRHYLWGSVLLAVMTLGTLGGWRSLPQQRKVVCGAPFAGGSGHDRNDRPGSVVVPVVQRGNLIARKAHVGLNMNLPCFSGRSSAAWRLSTRSGRIAENSSKSCPLSWWAAQAMAGVKILLNLPGQST